MLWNGEEYSVISEPPLIPAAYSAGAGINTFNIADPAAIEPLQSELFPAPADNRSNPQEQARPHQAVLDPTGEFLVFPDLGADLLRVFKVDKETLQYTESVRSSNSSPFRE